MARCVPDGSRSCFGFTSAARVTRRPNGSTFSAKMATRSLRADGGSPEEDEEPALAPAGLAPIRLAASAATSRHPATRRVTRIGSGGDGDRSAQRKLLGEHRDGVVVHADAAVRDVLAEH